MSSLQPWLRSNSTDNSGPFHQLHGVHQAPQLHLWHLFEALHSASSLLATSFAHSQGISPGPWIRWNTTIAWRNMDKFQIDTWVFQKTRLFDFSNSSCFCFKVVTWKTSQKTTRKPTRFQSVGRPLVATCQLSARHLYLRFLWDKIPLPHFCLFVGERAGSTTTHDEKGLNFNLWTCDNLENSRRLNLRICF